MGHDHALLSATNNADLEYSFTVVHPVPTFDNTTQLMRVLDRMEQGTSWVIPPLSVRLT